MPDVFDTVADFFRRTFGESCEIDNNQKKLEMNITCKYGVYKLICFIDEQDIFRLYVGNILTVPEERRSEACVLLNMINEEAVPTYSLSLEDGELLVGLHFLVRGCQMSSEAVGFMFYVTLGDIDIYYPAMSKLIDENLSAKEAFCHRLSKRDYVNNYLRFQ